MRTHKDMPDIDSTGAFDDYKAALVELTEKPDIKVDMGKKSALTAFPMPLMSMVARDRTLNYDELIAGYVALSPCLKKKENNIYGVQAIMGIRYLQSGNFEISSSILREILFQTSTQGALAYVMKGVLSFTKLSIILVVLVLWSIAIVSYVNQTATFEEFRAASCVLLAVVFGMLGSVISIFSRLSEFENTKGRSRMYLTLTGATLPIIGGVFGAFVASLLLAKIITIAGVDLDNVWIYPVVGFLSGFSERFSRGILSIAEHHFVSPLGQPPHPLPPPHRERRPRGG